MLKRDCLTSPRDTALQHLNSLSKLLQEADQKSLVMQEFVRLGLHLPQKALNIRLMLDIAPF